MVWINNKEVGMNGQLFDPHVRNNWGSKWSTPASSSEGPTVIWLKNYEGGIYHIEVKGFVQGNPPIYFCCLQTRANNYYGKWQNIGMKGLWGEIM